MTFDPHRVIFLGMGNSPLCYYRCMLPAMAMGADWVGVSGEPPRLVFTTGMVRDPETGRYSTMKPRLNGDHYDIVVMQQPSGARWADLISSLRAQGVKVLFEIDDYLHGIAQEQDHQWRTKYDPRHRDGKTALSNIEWCMKRADGLIVSTQFIADEYKNFNRRVTVCRNGIDLGRYALTRPERPSVNIGWAGGTGHAIAAIPWLRQVAHIMRLRENVNFVSVGRLDFADAFRQQFPDERAIGVPWATIEQYPSAMSMFDIALAPAAKTPWWRGKSDLRWLEASALGVATVVDPANYPDVEDGKTGYYAENAMELTDVLVGLIGDRDLRERIGLQAQEYVREHRSMQVMVKQWVTLFEGMTE